MPKPNEHFGIYPVIWSVHKSEGVAIGDWSHWLYTGDHRPVTPTMLEEVWFRRVVPDFGERNKFVHVLLERGIIRTLICEKQLDVAERIHE